MRRLSLLIPLALLLLALPALAQDDPAPPEPPQDVTISLMGEGWALEDAALTLQPDLYGREVLAINGQVRNTSDAAWTGITFFADLYDDADTLIGEGIGFVVNACGTGLLPDFALQPGRTQFFSLSLEIFAQDAALASVEIFPEAQATAPSDSAPARDLPAVTTLSRDEVVQVEWIDETRLRYGVGCDADTFSYLTWTELDLTTGQQTPVDHPNADRITPTFLTNLRIEDEFEYRRSYLTFAPRSDRVVFQSSVNHFYTANPDGTARGFLWDNLSRYSLHGIIWQDNDIFLAYYYGAYGEDVLYFTASATSGRISRSVYIVAPSQIVPGPTTFGTHVIIGATFDDLTGYWYRHVFLTERELLFEADLPGNNWPAPIYEDQLTPDRVVYITRPLDDGTPALQCYNMDSQTLTDLTPVPLDLTIDDRAWTWLSPEGGHIALAANGVSGGLWLVDLASLPSCFPQD